MPLLWDGARPRRPDRGLPVGATVTWARLDEPGIAHDGTVFAGGAVEAVEMSHEQDDARRRPVFSRGRAPGTGAVQHRSGPEHPLLARRLGIAIRALYGYPTQLQVLPPSGYPAATHHRLRMTAPADAAALARRTGLADPRDRLIHGLPAPIVAGGVCDAAAIWRGAFLAAGSLTEPHRFPALDIVCPSLETAMALTGAARRLGITTKTKHLRGVDRVTVREPETITALLTTIGAPDTAATWARHRTHHQEHTPSPRLPGFDDANHTRALVILGDQVPENLTAVAALRITHREVSLEALGRMMDPPMTKDAVAGRIRRLLALADATARRTGIPDTTTALTPDTLDQP